MATWKLAPDTGQISGGPHSSMPLVVIPSEIEIGAITLAEAQSSRYYTDSGLVTEVAREVVSSDELHFDGSSVSSSSEYWMDFDGVRSDYAVTATYGRNAVWGDYVAVYHLNEAVNNTIGAYKDSTGKNDGTGLSMSLTEVNAQIGKGQDFDGTNDYIEVPNSTSLNETNTNNTVTLSAWVKKDTTGGTPQDYVFGKASNQFLIIHGYTADLFEFFGIASGGGSVRFDIGTAANTNWNHVVGVFDSANDDGNGYLNAVLTNTTETGSLGAATSDDFGIGAHGSTGNNDFDGKIDEVRVRSDVLSSNSITTEYNNQSNNAAFWVATDVSGGGGGGGWVGYPMIHMLQFNCVM